MTTPNQIEKVFRGEYNRRMDIVSESIWQELFDQTFEMAMGVAFNKFKFDDIAFDEKLEEMADENLSKMKFKKNSTPWHDIFEAYKKAHDEIKTKFRKAIR